MRQTIRLTEGELRYMIQESINEAMEEGRWNQFKQGAKAFFGKGDQGSQNIANQYDRSFNGGMNLGKRWNAAKTNYQTQGVIDNADEIIQPLRQMVQNGEISNKTTVGQLFQMLGSRKGGATTKGSAAMNRIYR